MFGHLALILTAFRHYPESGGQNVSFHYYSHLTSLLCFLVGIVSCNNVGRQLVPARLPLVSLGYNELLI